MGFKKQCFLAVDFKNYVLLSVIADINKTINVYMLI